MLKSKAKTTRYRDSRPRGGDAKGKPASKTSRSAPKKTEKSTALVVVSPVKKLKKLEKQQELLKKASTTFGVPSKQLYSMIQEGKIDQAVILFQRQMLATILRLIPIAEKQYRREKKEHTAYALNSLVSQARELTSDIQSSADRAAVAEVIVTEIMMPTFRSFVETLVVETQTLKAALQTKVLPKSRTEVDLAVDGLVKQVARTGNELFRSGANSIRDMLGAPKKRGVSKP